MAEGNDKKIVHASVEVSVDPNYTTAFFTIKPPENGGLHITLPKVKNALAEKNIYYGIDEEAVADAVAQKRYDENICAAKWLAPVDGIDGTITYAFKREKTFKPMEDENGNVDFKNLGLVKNIYAGTVIATITLPTEGTPGKDIMGRPVRQKLGVPAKYSIGNGTELTEDGTQILATVDGNLVYSHGAFSVDEKLFIKGDVDVSSGNIDFIGEVVIKGNVLEGFSVKSGKNITIFGSVTNSTIEAQDNILIKLGSMNSEIRSEKGSVKIDFCENSKIYAGENVEASSFVGGEVFAGNAIKAVGKGVMMGGKYTALEDISASVIGSDSYAKTLITLGNNAVLSEERMTHKRTIVELEDKLDQLGKVLSALADMAKKTKLTPDREQMKVEAMRSRFQMQGEIKRLRARIAEIETTLESKQNLSVSCKRMFYPGVIIKINSYTYEVHSVTQRARATIGNGEIVMMPL